MIKSNYEREIAIILNYINENRAIHGSGWIGFGVDPHLT